MGSLWLETQKLPSFPPLSGSIKTDVLVIGGGLAGLLCAARLQKQGLSCVVAEANTVMGGISGHTTAKLTAQHGLIYTKLVRRFGRETASLYYRANSRAIEEYRALARRIPCGLEDQDAILYARGDPKAVEREYLLTKLAGGRVVLEKNTPLPFPVTAAVRMPGQARFHPVQLAAGLLRDLTVYEHTPVKALRDTVGITPHGEVHAKHVIVATHFPFLDRKGLYFMKLYQQRSYVLGLRDVPVLSGMYLDPAENGLSFRMAGDVLLLGGGGHRTGKKGGGFPFLRDVAGRLYPDAKIQYQWATQDCMTLDGLPYIGPYSPHMKNIYAATGFGKWGMTLSMVSALLLTDLILGTETSWAGLFAPDRRILRPQLGLNLLETTAHLLRPTAPRCSHLGCALNWNKAEHTWDCSCHGSRFREDGAVLDGPAQRPIKPL